MNLSTERVCFLLRLNRNKNHIFPRMEYHSTGTFHSGWENITSAELTTMILFVFVSGVSGHVNELCEGLSNINCEGGNATYA